METKNMESLHEDHHEWMEDITVWHNELLYYSRVVLKLAEGVKIGPDTAKMEEFQSKFDTMLGHFKEMAQKITAHDKSMAQDQAKDLTNEHKQMGSEVKSFKKQFNTLKDEFFKFEEKFIYE